VLRQILLELADQRLLVALELGAVARREEDRVLVGDVDARDGDLAVVVHLFREFSRQLDRLDVRPEGPAEDTLDKGLDLLLDEAENHGRWGVSPPDDSKSPA